MAFKGWSDEAVVFFEQLEVDNSRAFFQANKATYEEKVKRPMEELLDELGDEFGEGRIFRPNRDVRFSADKSPYKTNVAGTFSSGGYVSFSADGLGVGAGLYMPMPDQLERFRKAIDDDASGRELEKLVAGVRKKGCDVSAHETLKTAPKGYPRDHPRIDLLRMKGIITWRQWPPAAWLGTAKAKQRIVDVLRTAQPINRWIDDHVGATTMPAGR